MDALQRGAGSYQDRVWLESNVGAQAASKARTRELTYRALIEYLETQPD